MEQCTLLPFPGRRLLMFVRFALLGDAVVNTSGKWNLLGNFNLIWGSSFPMRWPQMGILLRIEGDHRETGKHTLRLDFVNETGQRLSGPDPIEFELPRPRLPGFPLDFVLGVEWGNLNIPEPGNYDFVIRVDDIYLDSVPLYVRHVDDRQTPQGQ